ncbi:MAG: sprA, partial [Bacteroidota bacterium]|nr:sprA [Bacteroidota bacterium]
MKGTRKIFGVLLALSCFAVLFTAAYAGGKRQPIPYVPLPSEMPGEPGPTGPTGPTGTTGPMKDPMHDRTGDFVTDKQTDPFYLKDPPVMVEDVEYDHTTGMYVITEKIGGKDVKPPTYMTYSDYLKYTEKQEQAAYFKDRANAVNLVEEKSIVPPIQVKKQFFDRLFGGSKIEIKPQGNVEMTLGANIQQTANPNIPIRNRKTGGFDFDMNINMNVIGKIGDKLQLGVKYNTQSGFQFDNQVKIGYTGEQDDIIKSIEAGNVSLPLPTRLISGSQTLFGVKTQFQFGRLTWTSVVSQQQSKKETMVIENGAQRQNFEIHSDQYEENKHFLLAQYFYNQYDEALSRLPNIRSNVNITRIEVWITNRSGVTQNVRDVAAMADLGEPTPASGFITSTANGDGRPRNEANNLYSKLVSVPNHRFVDNVVSTLLSYGLEQGQDFEKTYARKLNANEYTYNTQLGYISLNSQMNPNDVLGVAFQYEYNGKVFQVGEFGDQVPPDSNATSKVLYLKLLKGTSPRTSLPIWNLMMKNIYSLGAFNVSPQDFFLDIYYNDPGGGLKRYMPQGCIEGVPLLRELNLDNLDASNNPQPDGLFDFIPGVTILPQNGRLIFPVLKPFGADLAKKFCPQDAGIVPTYIYSQLYDSTKFTAQQYPEFNRFVIKGQYKGSNGSQISLGAGNIPKGSVVVTAGGQKLTEGTDYTVDYNLGRLTIINQSILNSGQQIKVDYENNNQFATQVRSLFGTRLDYKISPKFNIGATLMQLSERPFTQKVNIGDDPIKNTIMGTDIKYETNAPWLTKAISALPFSSTKEMSTISTYGEMAYLKPGHNRAINDPSKQGQVYIDDFEGTSTGYDLKNPSISWKLASTPRNSPGANGQILFPEANLINDERYGYN